MSQRTIYSFNTNGGDLRQLTSGAYNDIAPDWSPDGGRIAFCSNRGGGMFDRFVHVMDSDGTHITRLTSGPEENCQPDWSPDGTKIVFWSGAFQNAEIYTMSPDGSNVTRLTNNSVGDGSPVWSPDGSRIAFDRGNHIWVMNSDGSNQVEIVNSGHFLGPTWSPDGSTIAFTGRVGLELQVFLVDPDGSNLRRITSGPSDNFDPSWSPDSQQMVVTSNEGSSDVDTFGIVRMNKDGSNRLRLTLDGPSYAYPDWGIANDPPVHPVGGTVTLTTVPHSDRPISGTLGATGVLALLALIAWRTLGSLRRNR